MSDALDCIRILGIPFDGHASFSPGAAQGPDVIRKTLNTGSLNASTELGIMLEKPYDRLDAGDVSIASAADYEQPIASACAKVLEKGHKVISLGGDHSVSFPLVKAYANVYRDLQILHIDAHPDLYDELKGNRFSNGCPFARIMEQGLCTRLVQVGIRTMNDHQRQQAQRFGVEVMEMKDWHPEWIPEFSGPVYVSIDIDGIDPAFAPGVSHREPGGLSVRDVIRLIHRIPGQVVGADVVELNPDQDIDGMTALVAAKLVKEVAGRIIHDHSHQSARSRR